MKEFKGTPGAWYAADLEIFSTVAGRTKIGEATDLTEFRSDSLLGVQETNAKLFAASKQMLEALQELLATQEEEPNRPGFWWVRNMPTHEMLTKAKAALSAALD